MNIDYESQVKYILQTQLNNNMNNTNDNWTEWDYNESEEDDDSREDQNYQAIKN